MSTSKPTLASLPAEIRENIYRALYYLEYVSDLEYHDTDKHGDTTFCLRYDRVRPPALARVNRSFRAEYLDLFFRETTFRVPLSVEKREGKRPLAKFKANLCTADSWLTSLDRNGECAVQRIQFEMLPKPSSMRAARLDVSETLPDGRGCSARRRCSPTSWRPHCGLYPPKTLDGDHANYPLLVLRYRYCP